MINNHKAPLEGYSSNDNDLYGELKIQLTMQINFISSIDPGEIRTMDSKSKNIEILMGSEKDDVINKLLFYKNIKKNQKKKLKKVSLFLKTSIFYIIVFTKQP